MKFVAIIDLKKQKPEDRVITFITNDPGPVPPVIPPPEPDEPKDGGPDVQKKPAFINHEQAQKVNKPS